jgi:hypothetical protein
VDMCAIGAGPQSRCFDPHPNAAGFVPGASPRELLPGWAAEESINLRGLCSRAYARAVHGAARAQKRPA